MKEIASRAMMLIEKERLVFIAEVKVGYGGELDDIKTTADEEAQKLYARLLQENFPGYGIIGEENNLRVECTLANGENMFFTVDPLDGTKAYNRKQSHGIGTMIALVHGTEVIAVCIGDIMTGEMFYYRPESHTAHRLGRTNTPEELPIPDPNSSLMERYALLRDRETVYHPVIQKIVSDPKNGGLMKDITMVDGSIGTSMARLWKGEVGIAVLKAGYQTPWDWAPVVGISKKLGYKFFVAPANKIKVGITEVDPVVPTETILYDRDIIVVHENHADQLLDFAGSERYRDN